MSICFCFRQKPQSTPQDGAGRCLKCSDILHCNQCRGTTSNKYGEPDHDAARKPNKVHLCCVNSNATAPKSRTVAKTRCTALSGGAGSSLRFFDNLKCNSACGVATSSKLGVNISPQYSYICTRS